MEEVFRKFNTTIYLLSYQELVMPFNHIYLVTSIYYCLAMCSKGFPHVLIGNMNVFTENSTQ
jgi:hypothetical protein